MRHFKELLYCTVMVMTGLLLFSLLKDVFSEKAEPERSSMPPAVTGMESSMSLPHKPDHKVKQPVEGRAQFVNDEERLKRYAELSRKVLLNDNEATERERLLSHVKTAQKIASRLTDADNAPELKSRLSMIDFLEEAVAWNDNPAREEMLTVIEDIIRSEKFSAARGDARRQQAGDKIELFAILSQQAPKRAATLLEQTRGTKIAPILHYAVKRLALKSLRTEE